MPFIPYRRGSARMHSRELLRTMKRLTKYIIFIMALFVLAGCAALKESDLERFEVTSPLTIVQGENRIEVKATDTIVSISKKPFTLEFTSRKYDSENKLFYTTQIASTNDKVAFEKVKIGPLAEDHPFFGYATGKSAGSNEEYETMYIDNNGHHYIFYSTENDKRATLMEEMKHDSVRLSWTINSLTLDGNTTPIESTKIEKFYMLYFQDHNLNNTIEVGELTKLQLILE